MKCTKINNFVYDSDGIRHVEADLLSSTAPGKMPTTGNGIEGLEKTDVLDAGSTLYIVNTGAIYMMNEENEFKEQ